MRLSKLSVASAALLAFTIASADEQRVVGAINAETELASGWASAVEGESAILDQAEAVFAFLRDQARSGESAAASGAADRVYTVDLTDVDRLPAENGVGEGGGGCRFMEIPGSRIREQRCYFPSEGERALNEYQFREEIRESIERAAMIEMQRREAEARQRANAIYNRNQ